MSAPTHTRPRSLMTAPVALLIICCCRVGYVDGIKRTGVNLLLFRIVRADGVPGFVVGGPDPLRQILERARAGVCTGQVVGQGLVGNGSPIPGLRVRELVGVDDGEGPHLGDSSALR